MNIVVNDAKSAPETVEKNTHISTEPTEGNEIPGVSGDDSTNVDGSDAWGEQWDDANDDWGDIDVSVVPIDLFPIASHYDLGQCFHSSANLYERNRM